MWDRPGLCLRSIGPLMSSTSPQKWEDFIYTWGRTCTSWWDNAAKNSSISQPDWLMCKASFAEGQHQNQRQCAANSPRDGCHQGGVLPVQLHLPWQNHIPDWWDHGKLKRDDSCSSSEHRRICWSVICRWFQIYSIICWKGLDNAFSRVTALHVVLLTALTSTLLWIHTSVDTQWTTSWLQLRLLAR